MSRWENLKTWWLRWRKVGNARLQLRLIRDRITWLEYHVIFNLDNAQRALVDERESLSSEVDVDATLLAIKERRDSIYKEIRDLKSQAAEFRLYLTQIELGLRPY